jgi:hypothetical protein
MRSMLVGISALALMGSTSSNAAVSLVGTDVTLNYLFPSVTQVFGSTVLPVTTDPTTLDCPAHGSGVCSAFAESAAITIGADSFTVVENSGSSYTTASFNGVEFSNLDFGPGEKITGFSLLTNLTGLTPADISFTGDSIRYDASGLSFQNSPYFVTLTVTTAVPELSTYAMTLLGFAGLGFAGYRRSRNGAAFAV